MLQTENASLINSLFLQAKLFPTSFYELTAHQSVKGTLFNVHEKIFKSPSKSVSMLPKRARDQDVIWALILCMRQIKQMNPPDAFWNNATRMPMRGTNNPRLCNNPFLVHAPLTSRVLAS